VFAVNESMRKHFTFTNISVSDVIEARLFFICVFYLFSEF
jgi:hypothetical protein